MAEGWFLLFRGDVEGRFVELYRYEPTNDLRVATTQKRTEITEGYVDGSNKILPGVVSEGEPIEIEASDPDRLQANLASDAGFSEKSSREIARLARLPTKDSDR